MTFLRLCLASALATASLCAQQQVHVRVLDSKTGAPVPKARVQLHYLYDHAANATATPPAEAELNSSGIASFSLPAPEPARLEAVVTLPDRHARCSCRGQLVTDTVLHQGAVILLPRESVAASIAPTPGTITFAPIRLTLLQRLFHPFRRG